MSALPAQEAVWVWLPQHKAPDPFDDLLLAVIRQAAIDLAGGGSYRTLRAPADAYRWFRSADCAWIVSVLAPHLDPAAFAQAAIDRYWSRPAPPPILVSAKGA